MMTTTTLKSVVRVLKQMEFLDSEILDLFHAVRLEWGAVYFGEHLEIRDPKNPDRILLKVRIQNSEITGWEQGPACTNEILAETLTLAKELREPPVHDHILSRIMFSTQTLNGRWRYKELFQVVPCIHEINVSSGLDWFNQVDLRGPKDDPDGPPYPFLLEVSVPRVSNLWLQNQIGMKLLDRYEHLLCTFLKGVSNLMLWPNERQWIALKSKDDAGIEYQLLHSGIGTRRGGRYDTWSEWNGNEASFFAPEIGGVGYDDSLLPYQSEVLLLRSDLEQLMDKYFAANTTNRRRLDRSAYFFTVGRKLRLNADLATMNFSIAIECLLEAESRNSCKECGKDRQSLTKLFKEFLDKYAPVSEQLVGRRDKLYSVRSMIAHGSRSMVADSSPFSLARDTDTPMLMEWLVRKSIVGWLNAL